jgi:glycosyltransferase involved in cell wall biosynthesis
MNVLSLQPFFGGSHQQFHEGWIKHSEHNWTTIQLPARHWKWRMRHAAIHFAEEVKQRTQAGQHWDIIVATDMMNVAELRGLTPSLRDLPIVLYFHENQFAYPDRFARERDQHFAFTNFVSAVAADQIWFNSALNRDSMFTGLKEQANHWPDFVPCKAVESLSTKAQVQHPGLEVPSFDWPEIEYVRAERIQNGNPLHLIWAARWEHDKNPADLLVALRRLREKGIPFRLSVIGEQFRNVPSEFDVIRREFDEQIQRWGFQSDRESYWQALCDADVFVSTASHEFFGLAAAEAISAGLFPLLPDRLAYPELLSSSSQRSGANYLYGQSAEQLADALEVLHHNRDLLMSTDLGECFRGRFSWTIRVNEMDARLQSVASHANKAN